MREFLSVEFDLSPFSIHFGPEYNNYWAQGIKHIESGNTIDILLNENGDLVSCPDDVTDKLRRDYTINGHCAKIIPVKIDWTESIVIKLPTI